MQGDSSHSSDARDFHAVNLFPFASSSWQSNVSSALALQSLSRDFLFAVVLVLVIAMSVGAVHSSCANA